jgi:uncharacterized protein YjbI with pentapeptide repeats
MSFEIVSGAKAVLFHSETAQDAAEAVKEACLCGANLYRANLYGANLRGAYLYGANLRGANLRGAKLTGANLREAKLTEANLREATLCGANLREAKLTEAKLTGANLREANLREANLCEADLCEADLYGANLREANLCGANLREANLYGAYLRGANLRNAIGLLLGDISPLQMSGTRDTLIVREAGHITIGCEHHPIAWWETHYRELGYKNHYSHAQINEYRNFIALAKYWMKLHNVLEATLPQGA